MGGNRQKRRKSAKRQMMRKVNKDRQRKRKRRKEGRGHYLPEYSFLILGDGDFSFAEGLMIHCQSARGICATTFDSYKSVCEKYRGAKSRLGRLREAGMRIAFNVDARDLPGSLPAEERKLYDRVIFNFPHSGKQRVHVNRELIRLFFLSSRNVVNRKIGEVHLTLKTTMPYSSWEAEKSAKAAGFCNFGSFPFDSRDFPGYEHQTTIAGAESFEVSQCLTTRYVLDPMTLLSEKKSPLLVDLPRANSASMPSCSDSLSPSLSPKKPCASKMLDANTTENQRVDRISPMPPADESNGVKCEVCGRRFKIRKSMLQHCHDRKDEAHRAWMASTTQERVGASILAEAKFDIVDHKARVADEFIDLAKDDIDDDEDDDDVVVVDPLTITPRRRQQHTSKDVLLDPDEANCFTAAPCHEDHDSGLFCPEAEFHLDPSSEEDSVRFEKALDASGSANDVVAKSSYVTLTRLNFSCMHAGEWLNDEVVNFYLGLLQEYADRSNPTSRIYIHSTFMYEKLVGDKGGYNYDNVRRWTRNVKLSDLDAVLIPINFTNYHWAMVLVTTKDRKLWYFDSLRKLQQSRENRVLRFVERYLNDEIVDKGLAKSPITWKRASRSEYLRWGGVPSQENGIDCGVFACAFALCAVSRSTFGFSQKDIPNLRRHVGLSILFGTLHQSWQPLRRTCVRAPSFGENDTTGLPRDDRFEKYLAVKGTLVNLLLGYRKLLSL